MNGDTLNNVTEFNTAKAGWTLSLTDGFTAQIFALTPADTPVIPLNAYSATTILVGCAVFTDEVFAWKLFQRGAVLGGCITVHVTCGVTGIAATGEGGC